MSKDIITLIATVIIVFFIFKAYKKYNKPAKTIIDIDREKAEFLLKNQDAVLLDVRSKEEYEEFKIKRSINIPHTEIASEVRRIFPDKDVRIIIY